METDTIHGVLSGAAWKPRAAACHNIYQRALTSSSEIYAFDDGIR
jgi:hypothetical protein